MTEPVKCGRSTCDKKAKWWVDTVPPTPSCDPHLPITIKQAIRFKRGQAIVSEVVGRW